jgi:hypothetical protein
MDTGMKNKEIENVFNEILILMKKHAIQTTEHGFSFLYLIMESYKLIYEIDGLRLIKLFKAPFKSFSGGKLTNVSYKVLLTTKLSEKGYVLDKLECSEVELQAIHLEVKHKYQDNGL